MSIRASGATVASIARPHARGAPISNCWNSSRISGFSYACGGQAAKFKDREAGESIAGWPKGRGGGRRRHHRPPCYHSCHRALLAGAEAIYPLKVVNFTDVIAEALGPRRPSRLLSSLQGGRARDGRGGWRPGADPSLTNNGVRIDEASVQSLTADIFKRDRSRRLARGFRPGLYDDGAGRFEERAWRCFRAGSILEIRLL